LKAGTVAVQNGGRIMHVWNTATSTNAAGQWVPDAGVFIECSNLTVAVGGEINTDGLGYAGGAIYTNGCGPGGGYYGPSGAGCGGGGGYGGTGGVGASAGAYGGTTYGLSNNPVSPGSGGGGGAVGGGAGGGGYVKIVAASTVTIAGLISAQATNAATGSRSGGGSGGGIYIQCGSLSGSGIIQANGGAGDMGANKGGGGGGGRIAIDVRHAPFYTGGNLVFTTPPRGGTGNTGGGTGTIFIDYHPRGTVFSMW
jgi:hypothetical protein